jgi:hypothetical protein
MRHPLAATAAATLLLTACGAPSPAATADPAHQPSRPSAAQCARAKRAARQLALIPPHFTRATTLRSLAAADRRFAGHTSANSQSYLIPTTNTPPLSRELRRAEADYRTFFAAWATSSRSASSARAISTAAQNTIRDIHAISTTCTEHIGLSAAYQSSLTIRWPDGTVTHGIPGQASTGKRAAHAPGHQPIPTTDRG